MSSKKAQLEAQILKIFLERGKGVTVQSKAKQLAAAIDAYVDARIAGLTGQTGTGPGSPTSAGPLPIEPGSLTSP